MLPRLACIASLLILLNSTLSLPAFLRCGRNEPGALQETLASSRQQGDEERLKLAEEAAEDFIRRWHESLDLQPLFDELRPPNVERRCPIIHEFEGRDSDSGQSDETMDRTMFFAYWNLGHLSMEYDLAYRRAGEEEAQLPPELAALKTDREADEVEVENTAPLLDDSRFVAVANYASSVLRNYLSTPAFESPLYKKNLEDSLKESGASKVEHGFHDCGLRDDVVVYAVRRGVFEFYFIEDQGRLRIASIGPKYN